MIREEAIVQIVSMLASAFNREPSEMLFEAFLAGTEGIPIPDLQIAARRALQEAEHMPTPASLRRFAGGVDAKSRAELAWVEVAKAATLHGSYRSVDFDDKLSNAAIRGMGGWERLCSLGGEDFHVWAKRDFIKSYLAMLDAGVTEEAVRYLPGRTERARVAGGFEVDGPVAIRTSLPAASLKLLDSGSCKLLGGNDGTHDKKGA